MGRRKMVLLLWVLRAAVFLSAVNGTRVPAKSPVASPLASGKRNSIPAAAPPKEISSYSATNNSHLEGSSPAISHVPQEVGNSANTTHTPLTSHPAASRAISPAQNETWNPANSKHVPPASQPDYPSQSVISPASRELENPSNAAPSPLLHPIASPSISPSRNKVRIPSNNAHTPLPSQPGSTSMISPAPNEIRNPSNNVHASPPSLPGSSSAITPASYELKNPSNNAPSPLFLHPVPSPVIYPSPHEVKNPSSNAPSPHPASFPVMSPTPHKNNPHNYINTPVTLHPSSSPAVSPAPHNTDNPPTSSFAPSTLHPNPSPITSHAPNKTLPNTIYAPATSHPGSYPVISPAPHEIKKPSNTTPAPTSHSNHSLLISPTSHEVNSPPSYGKAPIAPLPVSSPDISPAPQDTKNASNSLHALSTSSPGPSPAVSPATYISLSNITHSPPTSNPGSYSVISPSPHEVKTPSNPIHVPSTSHTNLSPVISPTPHEVNKPLNYTNAHVTSHPGSSMVISPTPHNFKNLPNSTHVPLISHPALSPVISPTPDKTLSNVALPPVTSHPGSYPVTSPVAPEIKNPSNTTSAPLASNPSPSPIISPTHEITNSSNLTPAPPTSQKNPSPVMSPRPNIIRNPAMFNHSPQGSFKDPSPESGPVSHRVRNPSSSVHAPFTSYHSHVPAISPEPHKAHNPPEISHSESPAGSTIQSPLSAPTMLTHQHTAKQRMDNPAAAPFSPLLPPSYYPVITSTSPRKRHHPPPLSVQGPIHAPAQSPVSRKPEAPSPKPIWRLPPPPPNYDCNSLICPDTLANSPPGSPCDCVLPIKVELRVGVALYNFFPLVSEFAREIAAGTFINQNQVRIMGANAASEQPDKTIVLIDLVPSGKFFDSASAYLIYEKFWHKQVVIDASLYGDYDVLYVLYPGLPPSPPTSPQGMNVNDGAYGNNNNGRAIRPLAVDVRKQKKKHGGSLIAIIVLSSVICLVFVLGAAWLLVLKYRDHAHQPATQVSLPTFAKSSVAGAGVAIFRSGPSSKTGSFSSCVATYTGSAKTFTLAEIEKTTNRFDNSRIIGEGGFGRVYHGTLEDGIEVAVKVLKREDPQGGREFLAEVEMLSRLHHRNLVKLIGICTEDIPCLVYELIPNGSVESHLHGADKETYPLDWSARVKIALGAARGLAYLHEDSSPCVIHRDFKSSNILLEHDFTPKVSDFGLARTAIIGENEHISTRVMGTFGYVAPEYAMTGHLLVKSDVYSYGVVLLELLTGRKPVDMLQPPGQENLVTWARPLLTGEGGLERIIDPALGSDVPFDSVAKVAAIASMCVQSEVSHRPFMGEVVQALKLVCNESDEYRPSVSCSQEEFSVQGTDIRTNTGLSLEAEKVLSASDVFSTSERFSREASDSFRRHSSSGPLRTGKSRQFGQNIRGLSAGSVSEHGVALRFGTGLERHEQWS